MTAFNLTSVFFCITPTICVCTCTAVLQARPLQAHSLDARPTTCTSQTLAVVGSRAQWKMVRSQVSQLGGWIDHTAQAVGKFGDHGSRRAVMGCDGRSATVIFAWFIEVHCQVIDLTLFCHFNERIHLQCTVSGV